MYWQLILAGLASILIAGIAHAEETRGRAVLNEKPRTIDDGADPLRRLLVARYNAALADTQLRFRVFFATSYHPGLKAPVELGIDGLSRAAGRLLKADLELSITPV